MIAHVGKSDLVIIDGYNCGKSWHFYEHVCGEFIIHQVLTYMFSHIDAATGITDVQSVRNQMQ